MMIFSDFFRLLFKFFFVLTPFFVLSMFLSMTDGLDEKRKVVMAVRVAFSVMIACMLLLLFGQWIFDAFGITVDAFRIGGGALLFLSAVQLVNSQPRKKMEMEDQSDIAVVPLAIPVTVGPATTAVLFVSGSENHSLQDWFLTAGSLATAVILLGILLVFASKLDRLLGHRGLSIFSKLTGLILSALAAQMIFTGVKAFLG